MMRAAAGNGNSGECGRRVMEKRETKRARAPTVMATATMVAGNKKGNGNSG